MKILIDGDACSKILETEEIAKQKGIPCHIYCDASRNMSSEYAIMHIVDISANSADMAIIKQCEAYDVIITNDAGLAAMALAKKALIMNNAGLEFTDQNIMPLLTSRHIRQSQARKAGKRNISGKIYQQQKHTSFKKTLVDLLERASRKRYV